MDLLSWSFVTVLCARVPRRMTSNNEITVQQTKNETKYEARPSSASAPATKSTTPTSEIPTAWAENFERKTCMRFYRFIYARHNSQFKQASTSDVCVCVHSLSHTDGRIFILSDSCTHSNNGGKQQQSKKLDLANELYLMHREKSFSAHFFASFDAASIVAVTGIATRYYMLARSQSNKIQNCLAKANLHVSQRFI